MSKQVVNGAKLKCGMGSAPSCLAVLPVDRVMDGNQPTANVLDHMPMINIKSFGMCQSIGNPAVAAATAAALGVVTAMACIPNTPAPWAPGSPEVLIANLPALNETSRCICLWGGAIEVTNPGQTTTNIP